VEKDIPVEILINTNFLAKDFISRIQERRINVSVQFYLVCLGLLGLGGLSCILTKVHSTYRKVKQQVTDLIFMT